MKKISFLYKNRPKKTGKNDLWGKKFGCAGLELMGAKNSDSSTSPKVRKGMSIYSISHGLLSRCHRVTSSKSTSMCFLPSCSMFLPPEVRFHSGEAGFFLPLYGKNEGENKLFDKNMPKNAKSCFNQSSYFCPPPVSVQLIIVAFQLAKTVWDDLSFFLRIYS